MFGFGWEARYRDVLNRPDCTHAVAVYCDDACKCWVDFVDTLESKVYCQEAQEFSTVSVGFWPTRGDSVQELSHSSCALQNKGCNTGVWFEVPHVGPINGCEDSVSGDGIGYPCLGSNEGGVVPHPIAVP